MEEVGGRGGGGGSGHTKGERYIKKETEVRQLRALSRPSLSVCVPS